MTHAAGDAAPAAGAGPFDALPVPRANLLWAHALFEGLVAGGVRHVVMSPGSRSSPLAFAVHGDARLDVSLQVDERSAAFLALGIAKATRAPVAVFCTSGTAAANYLPAMAEAWLSGVPLVAVTADRPPELRGTGASQTIDQVELFGRHARWFADLPCPGDAGLAAETAARSGLEACRRAMDGAGGPVHLNVPFREPLIPAPADMAACREAWAALAATIRATLGPASAKVPPLPGEATLDALAARLAQARRPVLVAGPEAVPVAEAGAVLALARAAAMPVLADIASGLRGAADGDVAACCAHADLFLRDEALAGLAPDFVLRLGGIPTSKTIATWLARHRAPLVAVQPDARRRDPDGIVSAVVVGSAAGVCEALARRVTVATDEARAWRGLVAKAEAGARALLAAMPGEAAATAAASSALPAGGRLFLSSSMPVRWAEMYVTRLAAGCEVVVNRGANGIDGIVSSAIGVARGSGRPTLLVTGDLAFLHDAGGLRAARDLRTPLAILLVDNDGGGIFSHLPVARHEDVFEPFFGTPHGCDLAAAAQAAGIAHGEARTLDDVAAQVAGTFAAGGVRAIRWQADRAQSLREQLAITRLPGLREDRVAARGFAWHVRRRGLAAGVPLVLLHGFTGTGAFWLPVAQALPGRRCVMPDLPGHGGTDAPLPAADWRLDRAADALAALLDDLGDERVALAGYSMGGRLALALALRHPRRVAALALVGATPGIADDAQREARATDDLALADFLEREGIEAFCARWEANPLFATQAALAPGLRASLRAQRLAQDPARLAAALRAFGTGFQPCVTDEALSRLAVPVLAMAGEQDPKFAAIARQMATCLPRAELRLVPGAGHAVPLERADACAAEIDTFLNRSIDP